MTATNTNANTVCKHTYTYINIHKPVIMRCQKQSNYMMQSFSFGHGNGPSVLNVDPATHILIRNLRESTAHNTDHPQKKNRHIIQSIIFMKKTCS
jgi:hypothetical protein